MVIGWGQAVHDPLLKGGFFTVNLALPSHLQVAICETGGI
jgi:hypothetical protein